MINQSIFEEFKCKNRYIHFYQFEIFAIKAAENKENNKKKIYNIFHHNLKNIPCCVTSEVSLKRFYIALFDDGLTLKTLKLAYIGFCIQTLHLFIYLFVYLFINLFIYLFVYLFVYLFICLYIHLFIYLFIHAYMFVLSFI